MSYRLAFSQTLAAGRDFVKRGVNEWEFVLHESEDANLPEAEECLATSEQQGTSAISVRVDRSIIPRTLDVPKLIEDAFNRDISLTWFGIKDLLELGSHKFTCSKKGYFGMTPADVKPGDKIAIIACSYRPWYLREVSEGRYQVIGPGWIHGLMYRDDKYYQGGLPAESIQMLRLV